MGAIHFAPIIGVLGNEQLLALYHVDISATGGAASNDLLLLMRHRAILFGIIGSFIICAAFNRPMQFWALISAQINIFSFIALCLLNGNVNESLNKIMLMDILAEIFVISVMIIRLSQHQKKAK